MAPKIFDHTPQAGAVIAMVGGDLGITADGDRRGAGEWMVVIDPQLQLVLFFGLSGNAGPQRVDFTDGWIHSGLVLSVDPDVDLELDHPALDALLATSPADRLT